MSSTDDGGSMVCPVHGTHTRITCVSCGRPICPACAVTSPIGLTCGQHPQRSIRFVRWAPARGPVRSGLPLFPFFLGAFALAGAGRVTASFLVGIDPGRPWIGITVLAVLFGAVTVALLYWLRRRGAI